MSDRADRVGEMRALADTIELDAQARRRKGWDVRVALVAVRLLRWRAADFAAYSTAGGRRRSARRWSWTALVFGVAAFAVKVAAELLGWYDLSLMLLAVMYVALGLAWQARGWADGYEACMRKYSLGDE